MGSILEIIEPTDIFHIQSGKDADINVVSDYAYRMNHTCEINNNRNCNRNSSKSNDDNISVSSSSSDNNNDDDYSHNDTDNKFNANGRYFHKITIDSNHNSNGICNNNNNTNNTNYSNSSTTNTKNNTTAVVHTLEPGSLTPARVSAADLRTLR